MKTLLITRQAESCEALIAAAPGLNLKVIAESYIRFESLIANTDHPVEVLFFGSKNAVDFYLNQFSVNPNSTLTCIGESTAKFIRSKGFEVAFCGTKAGKPKEVGLLFKNWLNGRIPTLVQSEQSAGSIAHALGEGNYFNLPVYQTIASHPKAHQLSDIVVLTSPANAKSWLECHGQQTLPSVFIAWGDTTAMAMRKLHLPVHYCLEHASMDELINLLEQL